LKFLVTLFLLLGTPPHSLRRVVLLVSSPLWKEGPVSELTARVTLHDQEQAAQLGCGHTIAFLPADQRTVKAGDTVRTKKLDTPEVQKQPHGPTNVSEQARRRCDPGGRR
jgi:hypothetical protein